VARNVDFGGRRRIADLPGLVRYDEVLAGAIHHALRFTAPQTQMAYVWNGYRPRIDQHVGHMEGKRDHRGKRDSWNDQFPGRLQGS